MRNKKIIKLPFQEMVGVAKGFGQGDCTLTLCPEHFAFSFKELSALLEQTFNAGVNWKEKYNVKIKLKGCIPEEGVVPNFTKYLKQIQK